jgi:hypothetical protein
MDTIERIVDVAQYRSLWGGGAQSAIRIDNAPIEQCPAFG